MLVEKSVELLLPCPDVKSIPVVMTVAGSDSSGGAGIEADLKTMTSHGVYGLTCITALTAQNTSGVDSISTTSENFLRKVFKKNLDDFVEGHTDVPLKVVKTGMLTEEAARVLVDYLPYFKKHSIKLVVDPVMVSTSGSTLTDDTTVQLCLDKIFPDAFLCTPNYGEAARLLAVLGNDLKVESVEALKEFVLSLQKATQCQNLLVKGGHLPWIKDSKEIVDILYQSGPDTITLFRSPFIESENTHGTGCTLASAISSNLAKGCPLEQSVALAINFVQGGMVSMTKLGHGHGPLNHTNQAQESIRAVINGDTSLHLTITATHDTLVDYFKNHPLVSYNWIRYTQHKFLDLVATNTLPFERFLSFLKQDYHYLVNYAQIHGLAIAIAPDCGQIQAQVKVIASIMEELRRHDAKLKKYVTDVHEGPSPACVAYCSYLLKIGRTEDFLGIKVALAPCLHGYFEAGLYGQSLRKSKTELHGLLEAQSEAYASWLNDYTSEWYAEADAEGAEALDAVFAANAISQQRLEELTSIFNDVVCLEVAFWDEVTNGL